MQFAEVCIDVFLKVKHCVFLNTTFGIEIGKEKEKGRGPWKLFFRIS